jgi:hypothetical protein
LLNARGTEITEIKEYRKNEVVDIFRCALIGFKERVGSLLTRGLLAR